MFCRFLISKDTAKFCSQLKIPTNERQNLHFEIQKKLSFLYVKLTMPNEKVHLNLEQKRREISVTGKREIYWSRLIKSDKRFIERSKEKNQGFQINF